MQANIFSCASSRTRYFFNLPVTVTGNSSMNQIWLGWALTLPVGPLTPAIAEAQSFPWLGANGRSVLVAAGH